MGTSNIRTSGGIFTQHFVESLQQDTIKHPALRAETFAMTGQPPLTDKELDTRIAEAWTSLVDRWDGVERDFNSLDISALRQRWLQPLYFHLGMTPEFQRADVVLNGELRFPISHMARAGTTEFSLPAHSVLYKFQEKANNLELRAGSGRGPKAQAPHDMLQRYLNLSKEHDWALLSDGVYLRLLRDFHHTYTRGYVEFDLQGIFGGRDFASFRALYRLLHASRFVLAPDREQTPINELYEDAMAMGVKVGDDLRVNVQAAIESLANGFLVSAPGFIDKLRQLPDGDARFYRDVLMTIYRMLFLLFAEQRGMLPGRGSLYMEEFSMTAFRALAEQPAGQDRNTDLWAKMLSTFAMVENGADDLKVFAYNGALFSLSRTPLLTPPDGPAGPRCRNDQFLEAIRNLTMVQREHVVQRISYSDLSVEEIGSIYESLLEFTPRISASPVDIEGRSIPANSFFLDPRSTGRKTTGSYYTPPSLVNELIKSALVPVLEARILAAAPNYDPEAPEDLSPEQRAQVEQAILSIKVIDPAAGSGAFLIAANNKLGLELARIRTADYFPLEIDIQRARRDVLAHCIYAVDLNPMAVELCKVSLWINAAVEDAPLNFLDHHIQHGNSLVGATPELVKAGIPDDAYKPVTGDEKTLATALKNRNKAERKGQLSAFRVTTLTTREDVGTYFALDKLAEEDPGQAEAAYYRYFGSDDYWERRLPYDLWTAAFFAPIQHGQSIPTTQDVRQAFVDPTLVSPEVRELARRLAEKHDFFHYHLVFSDVFDPDGKGGFDVVLGNPPWERVKLQEKEFFEAKDAAIAGAANAAARKRLIVKLLQSNPALWDEYQEALRASECTSKFLHNSGAYPLTGVGDVNLYQVFAGKDRDLISATGRAGFIVPTGIATDDTNKYFFADLVDTGQLASLYDYENRKALFPGVHRSYKFCLLTLRGAAGENTQPAEFAFFLLHPDDLSDPEKRFMLTAEDFALLNPNTRTCPIFRSRTDAALTRKIYLSSSIFIDEVTNENPWGIQLRQGLFHLTNDIRDGIVSDSSSSGHLKEKTIPLFESKLIWAYDHRFATYLHEESGSSSEPVEVETGEKQDPNFTIQMRYFTDKESFEQRIQEEYQHDWFIVYRDITNSTNERTVVATLIPRLGIAYTLRAVVQAGQNASTLLCLLGNLNSFVFDYSARQSLGGTHLSDYVMKQLPVLRPEDYSLQIQKYIVPRMLELIFTSWDLKPVVDELWSESNLEIASLISEQFRSNSEDVSEYEPVIVPEWKRDLYKTDPPQKPYPYPPFKWNEDRRHEIKCELDALFGYLYGLTIDEVEYIIDTFPIVRRREESRFGEFRTKRNILEYFQKIERGMAFDVRSSQSSKAISSSTIHSSSGTKPMSHRSNSLSVSAPASKLDSPKSLEPTSMASTQSNFLDEIADHSSNLSDYGLYRCESCGMRVMGFDKQSHSIEKHPGEDPVYQKLKG